MSDIKDEDYYMTTHEVAAFFRKSAKTILNWKHERPDFPLPAIKSCPNLYRRSDIMDYAERPKIKQLGQC